MKVQYATANGRLTFEFESDNEKTLVSELAHIQEIFEEESCGCCQSVRIRFDVREFDGNHYYKLLCDGCGATLDYGQHKNGKTLFVKRFEKDTREPLAHRGWYRYKDGDKPGGPPTPPPPRPIAAAAPPKPSAAPSGAALAQQTAAHVAKAVDAMNHATGRDNLESWKLWAQKLTDLTTAQREKLEEVYRQNINRVAGAKRQTD